MPLVFKNLRARRYHLKNVKIFQGQNSQYWKKMDNSAIGVALLQRIAELNPSDAAAPAFTKIKHQGFTPRTCARNGLSNSGNELPLSHSYHK